MSSGWYPDPWWPAALRWWDGATWTPYTAAVVAPPDLEQERRWCTWARRGVVAQATSQVALIATFAVFVAVIVDAARDGREPEGGALAGMVVAIVAGQLLSLLALGAVVALLVWTHRTTANAKALGLPVRREPGLAAAGWVIPIVNYWWPYQAVRDVLPPGHPARPTVGWWWATYLGGSFAAMVALPAALAPWPVTVVVCLLLAAVPVVSAVLFRRIALDVLAAHEVATQSQAVGHGNHTTRP